MAVARAAAAKFVKWKIDAARSEGKGIDFLLIRSPNAHRQT